MAAATTNPSSSRSGGYSKFLERTIQSGVGAALCHRTPSFRLDGDRLEDRIANAMGFGLKFTWS